MSEGRLPLRLLAFLALLNTLNFFDRYIVQAVEPLLKSEFGLSNEESGYLGSAFVFGYVAFSPIFGFFSGRIDLRILMGVGVVAWSLFTGLTGCATTFLSFFLARSLVGVGEASFGAIVPAYLKGRIGNMAQLNSALSIFYVAIPVGSALGYIAGGALAADHGWRILFFLSAIPGILLSVGFLFVAKDQRERPSGETPNFLKGLQSILAVPVLRLTILGYIFHTFALNGIAMFVVRHVAGLGMAEEVAARNFGINLVITGFMGTLVGGLLSSLLIKRMEQEVRGLLLFIGASTLLGVPLLSGALMSSTSMPFFALSFLAQIALFAGTAPVTSVIVSRSPAGLESFTQGLTIAAIQLFGGALAPILIGRFADVITRRVGIAEPVALGYSLQLSCLAMTIAALVWLRAARIEKRSSP